MSDSHDTPKFTVVDRRKFRGDEENTETGASAQAAEEQPSKPAGAPRLKLVEPALPAAPAEVPKPVAVAAEPEVDEDENMEGPGMPPAPSAEESRFQKAAYDKSAERLDDLVRAQNPGSPAPEKIGFEHLVQQLYLSAMMQMGAGTPEGQRPRVDILGARQTIDLLGVVFEKTKGNLNAEEDRMLQTILFELRMTFLELTRMISSQPVPPMPPPPGRAKR